MTVLLPTMSGVQEQSWLALVELSKAVPSAWCLVGGQMVHLLCWERDIRPNRPTYDGDAVLDVRGRPGILREFTSALQELGFAAAGESWEGHQHRWIRNETKIDVLIPSGVGSRATGRLGVTGGTTLEAPGAQQALDRMETVDVQIGSTVGSVSRPNLVGALVIKAAAHSVTRDRARERHRTDFATLAAMITRDDRIAEQLRKRDRAYLGAMITATQQDRRSWISIEGAERGLDVLAAILREGAIR